LEGLELLRLLEFSSGGADLPYSVFDRVRQNKQADIVSNKRLGAVRKNLQEQQQTPSRGVRQEGADATSGGGALSASARPTRAWAAFQAHRTRHAIPSLNPLNRTFLLCAALDIRNLH
jgi:hypothetical protein